MPNDENTLVEREQGHNLAIEFMFDWLLEMSLDPYWVARNKEQLREARTRLMELPLDV